MASTAATSSADVPVPPKSKTGAALGGFRGELPRPSQATSVATTASGRSRAIDVRSLMKAPQPAAVGSGVGSCSRRVSINAGRSSANRATTSAR
jgi:hypothetical protein